MIVRGFRRIDTGQWLDVVFSTPAAEYPADPLSQAADLAAGLDIDAGLLEHVDGDVDPRVGDLLPLPSVPPDGPSLEERIARLEAVMDGGA